jgi:hypothetical protein
MDGMQTLDLSRAPALPFNLLAPGLGAGAPAPAGWRILAECPLLILVGVTGVGKSTLLAELAERRMDFTLLPDRRELTDRLIIAAMQSADGAAPTPVTDRKLRFAYTRRYREIYAGGMAHAVAQLWVEPAVAARRLVFDGLRGANEAEAAAATLPKAVFVMLDAPDWVRIQRLLNRRDSFDQIAMPHETLESVQDFAALGVPEAADLFSPGEEQAMLAWVWRDEVSAAELRSALRIVVEERRNYDPAATLAAHAPARSLHIDTLDLPPAAVADRLVEWWT